jgi:RNA polymerase subunit RPABC4/transcription elongation factor Spt4
MSLATCRDCGRQVSTAATNCPQCGRVFAGAPRQTTSGKWFVFIVALIGIGFLAFGRACATTSPAYDAEAGVRRADADLQYAAQEAVKAQLRDPESAKFSNVTVVHKPGSTAVCGEVNARNGFGGYTGYQQFMASGQMAVIRTAATGDAFVRLWNKACATSP